MENNTIKSPLRYPGGKSKALKDILPLIPEFTEYREPMVGGGSVFFALKQKYTDKKYWINDKNIDLYLFWKFCKENPDELISEIKRLSSNYRGKKLYKYLTKTKIGLSNLQRAARFFILNRIAFSGLVESGGYSKEAFKKRFTDSSIERITKASEILQGVRITNWDYSKILNKNSSDVFIFLDPPYMSKTEARLYGEKGKYNVDFDHTKFYNSVKKCKHKCLITYDKCTGIEEIYKIVNNIGWNKKDWTMQYGTNVKKKKARKGKELFIWNY
ncbi:MAG: DNA adenine methylase [Candidatus Micrarchaeota archaeon]|nr:DNA adenine methylase [Candidatus Micrarchaeota archaeon]